MTWFPSPGAALDALAAPQTGHGNLKRDLWDRPLFDLDQEMTERLNGSIAAFGHAVWYKGHGTAIRDAVWRLPGASLGYETQQALLVLILARGVQPGFNYTGLIADYARLAFNDCLRANSADLSEIAATFCAMTSSVWLLFPSPTMIYAVDRHRAAVENEGRLLLVFPTMAACRFHV